MEKARSGRSECEDEVSEGEDDEQRELAPVFPYRGTVGSDDSWEEIKAVVVAGMQTCRRHPSVGMGMLGQESAMAGKEGAVASVVPE